MLPPAAFAGDLEQRLSFYSDTPITDQTDASFLKELTEDSAILKKSGVVFAPGAQVNGRYPQAENQIDFSQTPMSKLSPETQRLASEWSRVRNYFAVKGQLEACAVTGNKRNLSSRLVKAIAGISLGQVNCTERGKTSEQGFTQLVGVNGAFRTSELEDAVLMKTLDLSVAQYTYLQRRYPSPSTSLICGGECDPGIQTEITRVNAKAGSTQIQGLSYEEVRAELRKKIDEMNGKLGLVQAPDVGHVRTSPQITPAVQATYNNYLNSYVDALMSPDGDLLITDAVQDKIGKIRQLEKDGGSHGKRVTYPAHEAIDADTVAQAIAEARDTVIKQIAAINQLYAKKKSVEGNDPAKPAYRKQEDNEKDLRQLLKANPTAVAQALMEHPEGALDVCNAISKVDVEDNNDRLFDDAFKKSTIAVGGVLLVTGVGSAAGAWLLGGAAAATAGGALGATTATLIAVGGTTAAIGTGVGVVTASYEGKRAYDHYSEYRALETSVLSHTGDPQTAREAQQELNRFNDARREALVNGAMSAADLGALSGLARMGKSVGQLKLVNRFIEDATEAARSSKVLGLFERLKQAVPEEQLNGGLRFLSGGSEKLRVAMLEKLAKVSPEKLRQILEQASKAGLRCGL